jgi:putative transposase
MVVRKRLKLTGSALVFVTTTVTDWHQIFKDEKIARILLDQLRETLDHFQISLVGYVVMPSHLRVLMGFRHIESLSKFMQSFKILSSKRIKMLDPVRFNQNLWRDGKFQLWQPRFDDVIITSEEQFRIKLEYIHNNPVKAKLVARSEEWRFSSAVDWLTDRPGLLPIAKDFDWVL